MITLMILGIDRCVPNNTCIQVTVLLGANHCGSQCPVVDSRRHVCRLASSFGTSIDAEVLEDDLKAFGGLSNCY